jgi:proteasome lid subunit RPN8/RPN11
MMNPECERELREMAAMSPEREICGFIMDGWIPLPVENVANSDREFYMDETQLLHVYQCHRSEILGVYHSHPGGSVYPSDSDETFAPKGMRYWIVTAEAVVEWEFGNGRARQILADDIRVAAAEVRQIPVPRSQQSCH